MHTPVLLQLAIENLNIQPGGLYIDATFGEGGYSQKILSLGGKVLAIDLDDSQLKSRQIDKLSGIKLVQGNFAEVERIAKENYFFPVDGVIFDLGLSMRQINESGRGFSFKKLEEPLDMRLSLNNELTARDLLGKLNEQELFDLFAKNSEEVYSKAICKEVVSSRKRKSLQTVADLIRIIDQAVGKSDKKIYSRIFQALRITVNDEFNNLKKGLSGAVNIMKKNGRIVVVSFHSLEDRIVKNFVRNNKLRFLNKKPIKGIRSFERSAKLRTIIS